MMMDVSITSFASIGVLKVAVVYFARDKGLGCLIDCDRPAREGGLGSSAHLGAGER